MNIQNIGGHAVRVEKNTEQGTIGVDLVIIGAWYRIMAGGVVLSPMYYTKEDAMDAADVILDRLCEGVLLVEPMPEGPEDQAPDFTLDDGRMEQVGYNEPYTMSY